MAQTKHYGPLAAAAGALVAVAGFCFGGKEKEVSSG
jgi:hypothetical protein